ILAAAERPCIGRDTLDDGQRNEGIPAGQDRRAVQRAHFNVHRAARMRRRENCKRRVTGIYDRCLAPPKAAHTAVLRSVPEIVTTAPPAVAPLSGKTESISGGSR